MFTGIIEAVGRVTRVVPRGGGVRLRIASPFSGELHVDESVSIAGACQTVVACDEEAFEVVSVEETLAKTNLGTLKEGSPVNLERAMKLGGRLDGHMVQGHVDTTGTVTEVQELGTSWLCSVQFDEELGAYLIPQGSVCLDGVSLTVARLDGHRLSVAIIPHTWEHTTISRWKPGSTVNIEFDMLGKYVVGFLERQRSGPARG